MSLCEIYPLYVSDGCIPASVVNNVVRKKRTRSEGNLNDDNKRSYVPIDSLRVLCTAVVNASVAPNKRPDEWVQWISYIKQHGASLRLKHAALLYVKTGHVIAASKYFTITREESETIRQLFPAKTSAESFRCGDRTYVVKSQSDQVVVGFYGGTYMIIGCSGQLYVLALCTSRTKSKEATAFIVKVVEQLSKTKL